MNDSSLCTFEKLQSPVAANQDDQLHAEEDEKDSDEDELEYIENDAVRKWQYTQDDNVLMDNMFPENEINVHADDSSEIANIENEGVSVAPGEGQMPTNILSEKDWDVTTFPHLFPNGRYGLHYKREQKLTNLQYFNQRLLNKDVRYSVLCMLRAQILRNSSWRETSISLTQEVQEDLLVKVIQYSILKIVL